MRAKVRAAAWANRHPPEGAMQLQLWHTVSFGSSGASWCVGFAFNIRGAKHLMLKGQHPE